MDHVAPTVAAIELKQLGEQLPSRGDGDPFRGGMDIMRSTGLLEPTIVP
jgi:hypothetical protein